MSAARSFVVSLVAIAAVFAIGIQSAAAQGRPPLGDFSTMRFSPAPGASNYLEADGAVVRGNGVFTGGLVLDYAHRPLTLYQANCDDNGENCSVSGTEVELNRFNIAGHIWGSLALFGRLQISAVLPLVYTEGDAFTYNVGIRPERLPGGSAFALADPRLHVKVGLFETSGFRAAAIGYVTFPTGNAMATHRYVGEETVTFGGHFSLEYSTGPFRIATNLGGTFRDGRTLFSTTSNSQFNYALALGYDITPLLGVVAEGVGSTSFRNKTDENALEARLGLKFRIDDIELSLAGGVGILGGLGVPVGRGLVGISFLPVRSDSDGDGLLDNVDGCPAEAEDVDNFQDEDGCPDNDNDQDGIPDSRDSCPSAAEDMDGDHDEDGCPDSDIDGDGITDGFDSCPNEPEDMDGDRDDDGCPDQDRDRDGVQDSVDQCPDQPEDTDGYGDEDGCPEEDFDADGVPDDSDQCPDVPEDRDGFEDQDGCPEEGSPPPRRRRTR